MQTVYDKDRFSGDDKMGNTEIDLRPFLEAHQMELDFQKLPNGCAIKRIRLGRTNGLAEESTITWSNGKIIQNMILRLRNMECGEIEIMLKLTAGPGFSGLGREGMYVDNNLCFFSCFYRDLNASIFVLLGSKKTSWLH